MSLMLTKERLGENEFVINYKYLPCDEEDGALKSIYILRLMKNLQYLLYLVDKGKG